MNKFIAIFISKNRLYLFDAHFFKKLKKLTVGMLVFLFVLIPLLEVCAADDSQSANVDNDAVAETNNNSVVAAGDNIAESELVEEENLSEDSGENIGLLSEENQDADYDEEQKITGNKPYIDEDSNTGDLLYNYPLAFPPGRNGMQPNLILMIVNPWKYRTANRQIIWVIFTFDNIK